MAGINTAAASTVKRQSVAGMLARFGAASQAARLTFATSRERGKHAALGRVASRSWRDYAVNGQGCAFASLQTNETLHERHQDCTLDDLLPSRSVKRLRRSSSASGDKTCGNCRLFQAPSSCLDVQGPISEHCSCRIWLPPLA
jgi:hypothetical protein